MRNWSNNPQETRRKMREVALKNGNKPPVNKKRGFKHSIETRDKISTLKKILFTDKSNHPRWEGGKSMYSPKEYLRNLRNSVIEILGGKCVKCNFSDFRALQIDHINGGGSKERKERAYKGSFHRHVIRSFLNKENKYQLLCANCNWIKRFDSEETVSMV